MRHMRNMRVILPSVFILIVFMLSLLAVIPGCGKTAPKKTACTLNSDCPLSSGCMTSYCEQGICKSKTKENCCGNSKCDSNETKCTCAKDCTPCAGKYRIPDSRGKLVNATYLELLCTQNNSQCEYSYKSDVQKAKEFFNEFTGTGFKFNIYVGYLYPFDLSSSQFSIRFTLKDYEIDKVQLPIKINEIRIMEGTRVIAQQIPDGMKFYKVTDTATIDIPVKYEAVLAEELKTLQVQVDYEYVPLQYNSKEKEYVPLPIERKTYTFSITDKIFFMDPRIAK